MRRELWYAVIVDADYDDWGYGSESFDKAKKMCSELENENAFIAVIDTTDDDPLCIAEIRQDEFQYYGNQYDETIYNTLLSEREYACEGSKQIMANMNYTLETIKENPEIGKKVEYRLQYTWDPYENSIYELYGKFPGADYEVKLFSFYGDDINEDDPEIFWGKVDALIEETLGIDVDYDLYI